MRERERKKGSDGGDTVIPFQCYSPLHFFAHGSPSTATLAGKSIHRVRQTNKTGVSRLLRRSQSAEPFGTAAVAVITITGLLC